MRMNRRRNGVGAVADPGPSSSAHGAAPGVEIVRHADIWDGLGVREAVFIEAAEAAFAAAPPPGGEASELTIVLTGDEEMAELNRLWRGKDASTNVLSFPGGDGAEAEGTPRMLGDIVLAAETVVKEARDLGIALPDHVSHLVVHGVLHLLGFDHEDGEEAERMEALETTVLAGLGIADPYAGTEGVEPCAETSS